MKPRRTIPLDYARREDECRIDEIRNQAAHVVLPVGRGCHYDLQMHSTPIERIGEFDCVLIVTDHSDYDYARIVAESKLVVDTRNATKGILAENIFPC